MRFPRNQLSSVSTGRRHRKLSERHKPFCTLGLWPNRRTHRRQSPAWRNRFLWQDPLHRSLTFIPPLKLAPVRYFVHSFSSFPSDTASPAHALTTRHRGAISSSCYKAPLPALTSRRKRRSRLLLSPIHYSIGADVLRVALKPHQH